jgi:DNA mismatch repair protein MutL
MIRILPPHVAEKIAAGEVIERPSSVIKELVENAIDAGATEIAVTLEDGGKGLIEVLDNGRGMSRDDLGLCVKRHATSKISGLQDLENIRSLGFRGEALPSIAAVSDLSIVSRAKDSTQAHRYPRLEPITFGHFLGSSHGTLVRAQGLFSQVPARLKFLKAARAEVSVVKEWLMRLALTHPEIGFRLISEDRSIFDVRPQSELDRVRSLLTEGQDLPVLFEEDRHADECFRLYWIQGSSESQSRNMLQVVNGRAVRDRVLQQALLSAFKQVLLPGQFPSLALFVEISPAHLDVNVHPTKTEVRFLQSSEVFRSVQSLAQDLLGTHGAPRTVAPLAWETPEMQAYSNTRPGELALGPAPTPSSSYGAPASPPSRVDHAFRSGLYLGSAFKTYLLFDLGTELGVIDQHAAHERVRYERLKRAALNNLSLERQELLMPESVPFPEELRSLLEERLPLLQKIGFTAELFGERALLFRAVPAIWGASELSVRLKNLVDRLLRSRAPQAASALHWDEELFESIASEACHSAVRAGDTLDRFKALQIVEQLFECEHPWNCPHGRPTVVRVPRGKLEEWFLRRAP